MTLVASSLSSTLNACTFRYRRQPTCSGFPTKAVFSGPADAGSIGPPGSTAANCIAVGPAPTSSDSQYRLRALWRGHRPEHVGREVGDALLMIGTGTSSTNKTSARSFFIAAK